jgi:hypothetical protein
VPASRALPTNGDPRSRIVSVRSHSIRASTRSGAVAEAANWLARATASRVGVRAVGNGDGGTSGNGASSESLLVGGTAAATSRIRGATSNTAARSADTAPSRFHLDAAMNEQKWW